MTWEGQAVSLLRNEMLRTAEHQISIRNTGKLHNDGCFHNGKWLQVTGTLTRWSVNRFDGISSAKCAFGGWQKLGQSNGSSPHHADSNCRPPDQQAQEAQFQAHNVCWITPSITMEIICYCYLFSLSYN
ncbi:Hypothetical predicted protein [Podarcis lilfordi]|uniref:Uncharacterized protein n=1 Tax=Podarcis lilfordi TaxID=74358 RepID=A0AA35P6R8_9SAUR|nr:Hypothetical predicted protein [Podarcis lilfordi]